MNCPLCQKLLIETSASFYCENENGENNSHYIMVDFGGQINQELSVVPPFELYSTSEFSYIYLGNKICLKTRYIKPMPADQLLKKIKTLLVFS